MNDTAIIVPTYGQEEYTARCFDSLWQHSCGYRLIWVDNGSTEESRNKVEPAFRRSGSRHRIWRDENLGFVKAVNLGLKEALARSDIKYIVIQNNDTIVTSGWLNRMRSVMAANRNVAAVGPITTYGATQQAWKHIWTGQDVSEEDSHARQKALVGKFGAESFRETPIITFFCTMFRREVFDKLGTLDEDYGVGLWDDQDLCDKIRRTGWKIAVAMGAYVRHYHRTTFKAVYSNEQIEAMKKQNQQVFSRKIKERNA